MAVKEPGWTLEGPCKREVEIEDENGDDNRERIKNTKQVQTNYILLNLLKLNLKNVVKLETRKCHLQ